MKFLDKLIVRWLILSTSPFVVIIWCNWIYSSGKEYCIEDHFYFFCYNQKNSHALCIEPLMPIRPNLESYNGLCVRTVDDHVRETCMTTRRYYVHLFQVLLMYVKVIVIYREIGLMITWYNMYHQPRNLHENLPTTRYLFYTK